MNKFATKSCKRFPPHLNNIPTTLEMFIAHVLLSCWS